MNRLMLRSQYKCVLKGFFQKQCHQHTSDSGHRIPREAGFGKVLVLLAPLATMGGLVTYAKFDHEFRRSVEENIPGSASVLKILLKEEQNFQSIPKRFENISKKIVNIIFPTNSFFGDSNNQKAEKFDRKSTASQNPMSAVSVANFVPESTDSSGSVQRSKSPDTFPENINGIEKDVEIAGSLAVQEYVKAINILKTFNDDVRQIVDKSVEDILPDSWTTLKNKTKLRDSSVQNAEKLAQVALQKIEKCEITLSRATDSSDHSRVMEIRHKIKTIIEHINAVKDELYRTKDMAALSEKYWKKVEASRNYFADQIESIFPGVNFTEKKLIISQEDLDLFIMHAYSHVLAYQKELLRLQTDGELRLKRAIEAFRDDDKSLAVSSQLDFYLEEERRKISIANHNKILQIRCNAEKQLRQQLKQQAVAHIDHLNDAISLKEFELRSNFSRELDEKLASEKAAFKLQLATMLGKLQGIDSALKARAVSEKSTHQTQALWGACQALLASVRGGDPAVHWSNKLRPLKNEIHGLAKVSEGDELVSVVLQNLPKTAENRGVFPEDALRERFGNVERTARKVAIIPEEGAWLPIYFLSYLQSLFILRPTNPLLKDEVDDKTIDFSKFDTYEILNKARHFVDRDDFLLAMKYMNLLQGAPRKVANDWLNETRLFLETQQAANTVMNHAAASGLFYL